MIIATSKDGYSRRPGGRGEVRAEAHRIATPLQVLLTFARLAAMVVVSLLVLGCGHTRHGSAVSEDDVTWRSDFQAFTETLHAVAKDGKVPSLERLLRRYRANWKSVDFMTDGLGGIIELPPREGTAGWLVNRHFSGKRVCWVVTASWEPGGGIDDGTVSFGVEQLAPEQLKATRRKQAEVVELEVPKQSLPDGLEIKAGDELVVEGRVGDANQSDNLQLSGVNTAYHYCVDGKGRTVFVVVFDDAEVRRANGAGMGNQ